MRYSYLLIFMAILAILGGLYLWQTTLNSKDQKNRTLEDVGQTTPVSTVFTPGSQRVDKANLELQDDFSKDIPQPPEAKTLESYNLVDPDTNVVTDGVVVYQSNRPLDELKTYYHDQLKNTGLKLVENFDRNDTETMKILVYSTVQGVLVIKIEKNDQGSRVTIRNVNFQGRVNPRS